MAIAPLKSINLRAPKAPNLPIGPVEYSQAYQDQILNALRLYFNQIDNFAQPLITNPGGIYLKFPSGSFYDTDNQYDGSTTLPYAIKFNSTYSADGVTILSRNVSSTSSIAATTLTCTAIGSGRFFPGMILSGTGVTAGTYIYLQLSSTSPIVASHTFSSGGAVGTNTVVLNNVDNVQARQFVSGTGVPANTRVISVDSATKTVTLSANFTVQAAGTYSFRNWGYEGTYSVSPSQTVASTTINGTLSSLITPEYSGRYNIQFSLQFANTSATEYDADVWFKVNDQDIASSNTQVTVPGKHGSVNGHVCLSLNIFLDLNAGDSVEIVWHAENSSVFIENIPAQTNPIRPAAPSSIVTVSFVSGLTT